MFKKIIVVCTLLICGLQTTVSLPQEFQKCLTFSEEILNQNPLLARPLKNRPETQIQTDHFIVHFIDIELHPTDPDATNYGYAAFIATIAEQVWNKQVNQFGWPQPPGDGTIGGGTNKYDIYLLHLSDGEYPDPYGYTKPEDQVPGTNGYTSYVVVTTGIVKFEGEQWRPMTDDEIKATVAHEFHHALQDGLTWLAKQMNNNSWFYENTATWMEEICYPEVDDWIVALINDPNITTTCLKKPYLPIDHWGNTIEDQYQYSGALFCHTMSKWKGNSIIKDIWLRAKNTTVDFVNDIDYVLIQNQTSLAEVLKRYAVWRYYTGENDDGNHFDKASLMEGLHILREHNNGTGSGNSSPDNLNSKGGTSYVVFKNADGVVNINFDGQNNTQLSVTGLNKRIYFSDIENNFTLNSSNDGTINNQSCIGEDYVVLIPVVTDWQNTLNGITYSYSSTLGTGMSTSFWTEKENTNLNGVLSVQLSQPILSGNSRGLTNLFQYRETTNWERFPDFQGKPVKHNNWNLVNGEYFLTKDFQASSQNNRQSAKYEFLEPTKVRILLEGNIVPCAGIGSFQDPWYVLSDGSQPGNYWINFTTEYEPTGKESATEKGVFLYQGGVPPNLTPPFYSVKVPQAVQDIYLPHTGRHHKFYFKGWAGTEVQFQNSSALQTGVVFKDDIQGVDPVANANYKGTQLSNNQNAFSNNGQRKFIRTYDQQYYTTRFHLVYESMNKVWYERSTDGINWEIMNNGQPIYEGIGKHPSIDALPGTHNVIIVYNKDEWVIAAQYYQDGIFQIESIVCDNQWVMENAKPVIACAYSRFLVAWDDYFGDINYRFGQLCTTPVYYFHWYFDNKVVTYSPNTIKNNVTIAAAVRTSDYKSYWLAWDLNQLAIQVVNLKTTDDVNFQESQTFTFDQSGFSKNYKPSIIVWKNGNETYDRVRVNWIAFRKTYSDNPQGGGEQSLGETKVFFRSYDNGIWSAYDSYGSNVTSVNINKNSDNSYAFAWSEGDGVVNKFIRSDNLTNIRTQNTNGKYLQVGNYANLNSMRLMSFKTSTPPYYFLLSNAFNWIPPQQIEPPITDREGVITKDTTSLYFSVGEITVDGEKINFVALPDTSVVNGSEALNTYLISEPFNLTENTFFTYGVQYGVTDSLSAAMTLTEGKSVNFRVELIDEQTNEVLGTFDDVTFSEGSIIPYESLAYQVNTEGIGNRICRLRLVINDNLNPDYSLTNDYNDEAVISKQGFVERTLNVNEIVKTYDLEQNYPNPFNPATTIRYQLPKEGLVTLKVYDILGSEVATLINEQKTTGKYEVNFNASNLASGVYVYRLSVNDYVNVKKMILLK